MSPVLLVALLTALAAGEASASTRGSLTTSVGILGTLAMLFAVQSWSAVSAPAMPAASELLLLVVAAALLWRTRRRWFAVGVAAWSAAARRLPIGARTLCAAAPLAAAWDRADLTAVARDHFLRLQAAWDANDLQALAALTTPDLLEDLRAQLPERGDAPNRTDVLSLRAHVLCCEELASAYLLSVEFSGLIRESPQGGPVPFTEVWMLARAKDEAAPWRLARQQALM